MWPLRTPGRGSGARPSNRSAGRASTTCAEPSASALRTSSIEATKPWSRRGVKRRGCGRASPCSSGRSSRIHFGRPPSRIVDVVDAEGAQRPPDARGGEQAEGVVDDEAHAVAEAERAHLLRRISARRAACAAGRSTYRRSHRCRRTPRRECARRGTPPRRCARLAADARRRRRRQARLAEMRGEPIGGDEILLSHDEGPGGRLRRPISIRIAARR